MYQRKNVEPGTVFLFEKILVVVTNFIDHYLERKYPRYIGHEILLENSFPLNDRKLGFPGCFRLNSELDWDIPLDKDMEKYLYRRDGGGSPILFFETLSVPRRITENKKLYGRMSIGALARADLQRIADVCDGRFKYLSPQDLKWREEHTQLSKNIIKALY
ncbi:MAG: hypothetical protein IPN70_02690 [Candidatus Moraniibacteriota bacterium]|nr:MAG: hypothetical protein IPN70_02690 [Candidatus Moranbacteria bacterium]